MKNARFWKKGFFLLGLVVFSMLFVIGCNDSSKPGVFYHKLSDETTIIIVGNIEWGAVNPVITIRAVDFKFSPNMKNKDIKFDTGTTGLGFDFFTYINATEITITFWGTAQTGIIELEIEDSETIFIKINPHISTTDTIACSEVNPTLTIMGTGEFKANISPNDGYIDTGTTGLTLNSATYVNSQEVLFSFTGTASSGIIQIQAYYTAFEQLPWIPYEDSNLLTINVCPTDPVNPWNTGRIYDSWITNNPFYDKHDGGWVYSAREDVIYAIYGNNNSGRNLYRIAHIAQTSAHATTWVYSRHGSHPVIDDTGTYIYAPPSQDTNILERYNTMTTVRETLASAPTSGTFSHGAWKNGKLWIVLDNNSLYSYDPGSNTWTSHLNFPQRSNVASSGPGSNLIYVLGNGGDLWSVNVTNLATTSLPSHPYGFGLGGNGQFTWFGNTVGFLFAAGDWQTSAIFDINSNTWRTMSNPVTNNDYTGHATYDTSRKRLYVNAGDDTYYYQY